MDTRGCPCSQCGKAGAVLRCSRCRQTVYCDATCQRKHWKSPSAPHKTECKASAAGSSASVVPVPSSSDPENPCPICFENEDNADAKDALAGMCYNCGHFFCGECNMYGKCAALQVIFSLLLFLLLVSFFFFIHTVPVDPSLLTPRAVDVHICVCVCVRARVQPYRTDAYILSSSN